jgi:hypothetical protein
VTADAAADRRSSTIAPNVDVWSTAGDVLTEKQLRVFELRERDGSRAERSPGAHSD